MKYIFLLLFLLTSISYSQGDLIHISKPAYERHDRHYGIEINYERFSTSSYFDRDGEMIDAHIVENFAIIDGDTFSKEYFFTYSRNTVDLRFFYDYNENFSFFVGSPLHIYNYEEQYKRDTISAGFTKAKFSLAQFEHFIIGGKIKKEFGVFKPEFDYELRLAYGDYDKMTGDPDYPDFLGDNATQFVAGINLIFDFEKVGFDISTHGIYYAEEFANRLESKASVYLKTVENTYIKSYVRHHRSLEPIPSDIVFDPRNFQAYEEFTDLGFAFWIKFTEYWDGGINYFVRLDGVNTWRGGQFSLDSKIKLDILFDN